MLDTTQKTIVLCRQAERQVIPAERRMALFERQQRAVDSAGEGSGDH